ncbi:hypothetical protein DWX23_04800 [Parabacteroides sp. AF18-52]|jgi:hypothetical protein|uniref:hypothetical protein n=2 Tax=Parabacteroides TaxID=375288 RepID=UPI000EFFA7A2|nr:hypothetical protein [Parabacteroides sp. AF18-52]RHR41873.1 hypothetical protein DWX23_04800 [Parabacteroides sp. AF18-52]
MYKIVIGILLFVNILLSVICLNLFKDKTLLVSGKQSVEDDRLLEVLENNFKLGIRNDNSILDTSAVIHDLNKNKISLSEIPTDTPCLVIRFSETNCDECVRFLLIKVMRLYNSDLFNKRILLFASYQNRKALRILIDRLNIKYPVYLIDKLPIPCEQINYPYCFILDSTKRTSHVFVPDKYEPQVANTYFELIENRYFKNGFSETNR